MRRRSLTSFADAGLAVRICVDGNLAMRLVQLDRRGRIAGDVLAVVGCILLLIAPLSAPSAVVNMLDECCDRVQARRGELSTKSRRLSDIITSPRGAFDLLHPMISIGGILAVMRVHRRHGRPSRAREYAGS